MATHRDPVSPRGNSSGCPPAGAMAMWEGQLTSHVQVFELRAAVLLGHLQLRQRGRAKSNLWRFAGHVLFNMEPTGRFHSQVPCWWTMGTPRRINKPVFPSKRDNPPQKGTSRMKIGQQSMNPGSTFPIGPKVVPFCRFLGRAPPLK